MAQTSPLFTATANYNYVTPYTYHSHIYRSRNLHDVEYDFLKYYKKQMIQELPLEWQALLSLSEKKQKKKKNEIKTIVIIQCSLGDDVFY